MQISATWSQLEPTVVFLGTGIVLGVVALLMLSEYRRLFMQDPRAAMSAEVLTTVVFRSGGPGYFAAILLAGALLFVLLGLIEFIRVLPRVVRF